MSITNLVASRLFVQDAALQKPREKEERKHLSSSWRSVSRPSSTDADDGMGPDDDFDDAGFPMDDDDERPDWNTSCPSTEYRNEGKTALRLSGVAGKNSFVRFGQGHKFSKLS